MLIRVTNYCDMGCPHCMVNAHRGGEHMPLDVYLKAMRFNAKYDPITVMVSGGEPTKHPRIVEYLNIAKGYAPIVCLISNGSFLEDEELTWKILNLKIKVQITNDPDYYPRALPYHPAMAHFSVERKVNNITPLGRAKTNGLVGRRRLAPTCYNLRAATLQLGNLQAGVAYLRDRGYFCTPSININGSVAAGEAPFCQALGTVESGEHVLLRNIVWLGCNECGLWDGLNERIRKERRKQGGRL